MKTCPKCFAENPDSARFCAGCGGSVQSPLEVFLQEHDLLKLLKPIQDNDFTTPEELLTLSDSDLGELGISLGDKIRLKKALDTLKGEADVEDEDIEFETDDSEEIEDEEESEDEEPECIGFTLTTETDLTLFDPTASAIRNLLHNDQERGDFMILTDSSAEDIYFQIRFAKSDDKGDWFDLEFRDGSGDQHYESTDYVSPQKAASMMISYGTGDDSWRKELAWKKLENESDDDEIEVEYVSSMDKAMDLINALPKQDRVYVAPGIPQDKLNAAFNSYVKRQGVECFLLYDVTVFGGAKDGFVIARDGLYLKDMFDEPLKWSWSEITDLSCIDDKFAVNSKKVMTCLHLEDGFLRRLVAIMRTFAELPE
jgi:hypothetical protein